MSYISLEYSLIALYGLAFNAVIMYSIHTMQFIPYYLCTVRCNDDPQHTTLQNVPYPQVRYGVRSPKVYLGSCVQLCAHWLRPRNSPLPPAFGFIYEGAIGQPKQTTSLCDPPTIPNHFQDTQHTNTMLNMFALFQPTVCWQAMPLQSMRTMVCPIIVCRFIQNISSQ